jgi:sporulation protein YlmC with PRC-barrel domain
MGIVQPVRFSPGTRRVFDDEEVAVAQSIPFTIGARANCTDGVCGHVTQVVVDPLDQTVTHVVVEPNHREGLGRLVPLDWIQASGVDQVDLTCARADFDKLERAEETRFLPGVEGFSGFDPERVLLWPYFGGNTTVPVTVDTLPLGEVAVRPGDQVHATDGQVGQVEGLVVDRPTRHVTHVLLREGHLFGRKEVAIPVGAVASVGENDIALSLSKQEVADLPAVAFDRRSR